MSNNQLLLQFLLAYMDWLYTGAKGIQFVRSQGLCSSLRRYYNYNKEEVLIHMCDLFVADGLDRQYPFNNHACEFADEVLYSTAHLNANRKIWVYEQIQRLQHEDSLPRHTQIDHRV